MTELSAAERAEVGDRVILAEARDRRPESLGTVIGPDPYPDRDTVLLVWFETGKRYHVPREQLRRLGHRMSAEDLAADLALADA